MQYRSRIATENRRLLANLSLGQDAHRALRKLAAERNMPMSRVVEDLILREAKRAGDAD
jgi:AmiR/NasT family two-component response regulator